ncbi:MAG: hypothetical protein HC906_07005 [Bacteroidales bacterium]|nr:hypothetical protein [Bacteroidales bacterium]
MKLLKAENDRQLNELRLQFETEKKEKDNEMLRNENALNEMNIKRKNALLWMFIVVVLFSVIFVILIYSRLSQKRKANKELRKLNIELEKAIFEKTGFSPSLPMKYEIRCSGFKTLPKPYRKIQYHANR